jgi:hypothetical protein
MSTTIVDQAGVTLPILDGPITAARLVENAEVGEMLRRALEAFVRAIRERAV